MSYPEIAANLTKMFFELSNTNPQYYQSPDETEFDAFNKVYTEILDNIYESAKKHATDSELKSGFKPWKP